MKSIIIIPQIVPHFLPKVQLVILMPLFNVFFGFFFLLFASRPHSEMRETDRDRKIQTDRQTHRVTDRAKGFEEVRETQTKNTNRETQTDSDGENQRKPTRHFYNLA